MAIFDNDFGGAGTDASFDTGIDIRRHLFSCFGDQVGTVLCRTDVKGTADTADTFKIGHDINFHFRFLFIPLMLQF